MIGQRFLSCLDVICLSITLFVPAGLVAQAPPGRPSRKALPTPDAFMVRKNVRRVLVDVTVRNDSGKPVRGLTTKDFSVSEDGRPQNVLTFEEHTLDSPSISLPPHALLPPNVFVNVPKTPERGPLYVILYDMVNMEMDDQIPARQQVLKFIRTLPDGARFAVYVHSDGLHFVQGFTDDKDLIYAALDPKNSKAHIPMSFLFSRNFGRGDPVAMMSVLSHIGEFMDGIPGRKNLIWLSGQFPLAFFPREGDPVDLRDDIRQLTNDLTRSQIAMYPVSIRGVVTNPEGALTGAGPHMGVGGVSSGTAPGTPAPNSMNDPSAGGLLDAVRRERHGSTLTADEGQQNEIAAATGGRAFYSDNGIKEILDEAIEDGGNYYTLSYSPTNPNYDGGLRNIKITLDQHGNHLSYRRSYYADDPEAPKSHQKNLPDEDTPKQMEAKAQERPMFASLQPGAPLVHQLIFKARIHPEGVPQLATPDQMAKFAEQPAFSRGRRKNPKSLKPIEVQRYAIYYVIVASQLSVAKDRPIPLEFASVAYDSDGFLTNAVFENVVDDSSSNPFAGLQPDVPESWEPAEQKVYRAMQELDVPVSARALRVAVRDTLTDRVGAMEIPLPVLPEPEVHATNPPTSPAASSGAVN